VQIARFIAGAAGSTGSTMVMYSFRRIPTPRPLTKQVSLSQVGGTIADLFLSHEYVTSHEVMFLTLLTKTLTGVVSQCRFSQS
jgi:uncharacterized membrane protein